MLVLGHGAGGGPGAPDLAVLAARLPGRGVTVVRVEQPWRLAGRRVAPSPARLDEGWLDCLQGYDRGGLPLVVGGRSAGARVACRTASMLAAAGVVCLAFPLHPPGRPERSRAGELESAQVPVLVVQGSRDGFGGPDEVTASAPSVLVEAVAGADHGFRFSRTSAGPAASLDGVADAVAGWLGARGLAYPRESAGPRTG